MTGRENLAMWAAIIGVFQAIVAAGMIATVPYAFYESGLFAGSEYENEILAATALPGLIVGIMGYRSITFASTHWRMAAATRRNRAAAGR